MDDINKLEDNIGIKNIVTKLEEGQSLEAVSGMAQKLIKNNSPDAIKNLKFALGENFEPFRARRIKLFGECFTEIGHQIIGRYEV